MRPIPETLMHGPFSRAQALDVGVSKKMLEGRRFVPIYRGVWRHVAHEMTPDDWVVAARLALPASAHLTGISRIQQLGLDFGPRLPVRFVVEGDLHLAFDNVFLHRTKRLAPTDHVGVVPAAAFIAYCARARVIDAIKVGDWLLHEGHTTLAEIRTLALAGQWRHGADEAIWLLDHLDARSRSLKESEARAILCFAGLPRPAVNVALPVGEHVKVIGDLWYAEWNTLIEYEGTHHQQDRTTYLGDLDRYALIRGASINYVQVAKERLDHARTFVGTVFRALVDAGYDGQPPTFGDRWDLLFGGVSVAVGPRKDRDRHSAVG
ncbi:hypothetical protein [Nocardioides mangrovi]|uniref:DUF559 domain-containing protein n=1 Tax=Nocardioides mangrovi TaxID=2874580 RepID=A0ABS7UAR2_9ACTN|nr:hypothetical protein [Nocardioides mangrovi]MBZ5738064.1 hypothetical protein [Nocardioides mangrovi]